MKDPLSETRDGPADQSIADQRILDRSEQAARFFDLARLHALELDEPGELIPLIAARVHDAMEGFAAAFDASDCDDDVGDGNGFAAGAPFGIDDTPLNPFD